MRFVYAVLVMAGSTSFATGQTTLRYSFAPGASFTQEWKLTQKVTMHVMAQQTTTHVQFQTDVVWGVKKVGADKNITLGLRFEKPRFTIEQGEKKLTLDGEDAGEGESSTRFLRTWLHDLSRTQIECVVTPEGVVESAALPAATLDRLKKAPYSETLADLFGEPSLKRLIGQALPPLPVAPVEKGTTWRQRVDVPHAFGKLTTDVLYTYVEPAADKKHKIGIKSAVKLTAKPGAPATLRTKVHESDGEGLFDAEAGRWLLWTLRQNVSLIEEFGAATVEYVLASDTTIRLKK